MSVKCMYDFILLYSSDFFLICFVLYYLVYYHV